jgi:protein subunit release factor A
MPKHLLFSLTAKDFQVQTFCTGGNGGQHRNAKQNGVRIIHTASGARAEHRDGRDQAKNKAEAFQKLAETWHKMECAKRLGLVRLAEEATEEAMRPANIKVEVKDTEGKWCDEQVEDAGR